MKKLDNRKLWFMLAGSVLMFACSTLIHTVTTINEDQSNYTKIEIDIPELAGDGVAEKIISNLESYGAIITSDPQDERKVTAEFSFDDLQSLEEALTESTNLFDSFKVERMRGQFILKAEVNTGKLRTAIETMGDLDDNNKYMFSTTSMEIVVKLPGHLVEYDPPGVLNEEYEGGVKWTIQWDNDEKIIFSAKSEVPLIPPEITMPAAEARVKSAAGTTFSGTGEPGADINLLYAGDDGDIILGETIADEFGNWTIADVVFSNLGSYQIIVREYVDPPRSADGTGIALTYQPLPPIVLVPGIYACSKGLTGDDIQWRTTVEDIDAISDGIFDFTNERWIPDLTDNQGTGLFAVAWDIYNELLISLVDAGYTPGENLYIACYDWSNSLPEEAAEVWAQVEKIYQKQRESLPVSIITHSNGGVIIRYAIQNDPAKAKNMIGDLIMIAPPNHGSADAYYPWEGGDIISNQDGSISTMLKLTMTRKCGMDFANGDLLSMFINDGEPGTANEDVLDCIRQGAVSMDISTYTDDEITSVGWLLADYAFLNDDQHVAAYPNAPITRMNTKPEIEDLFFGVQEDVYVIAGTGVPTLNELEITNTSVYAPLWLNGIPAPDQKMDDMGDGRVLATSADLPFGAIIGGSRYEFNAFPYGHTELVGAEETLTEIGDIIAENLENVEQITYEDYILVWVESPVNIYVEDANGDGVGVDEDGDLYLDIPGAIYGDTSDPFGAKYIFIPGGEAGTFEFQVTGIVEGEYHLYAFAASAVEPIVAEAGKIKAGEVHKFEGEYEKPIDCDWIYMVIGAILTLGIIGLGWIYTRKLRR